MKKIAVSLVVVVIAAGGAVFLLSRNRSETAVVETSAPTAASDTSATPAASTGVTVKVGANGFEPNRITVRSGDTITFVASADFAVDSDPHPIHTSDTELNLQPIQAGQSVRTTVTKKGTFGIHNHHNPSQKATVIVK
jgi:plastocyanin